MKFTCPCCGYKTLTEKPPGTFEICPICFWEDDNLQFNDPNFTEGSNQISLKQAQKNFFKFGAVEKRFLPDVRKPKKNDMRDPNWKILD